MPTSPQLTLFTGAIPAHDTAEHGKSTPMRTTCPDGSLPWSDNAGPDGWSARMFLHQLSITSQPLWRPSDTESLLSGWKAERLRASPARESSLSDVIKPHATAFANSFKTLKLVRSAIRRHLSAGRCLHVFVRTRAGSDLVRCSFGKKATGEFGSLTVRSESGSLDFRPDGLVAFLGSLAQSLPATPSSRQCPTGSQSELPEQGEA